MNQDRSAAGRSAGRLAAAGAPRMAQASRSAPSSSPSRTRRAIRRRRALQKFAELVAAEVRRQDQRQAVPGRHARRRPAERLGAAGRHGRDDRAERRLLDAQVKDFAVFDFPFLFDNAAGSRRRHRRPVRQASCSTKLDDEGLIGLGYWELGFRNVTNSKRPIAKVEDIAGLKMRVIQSPIYIDLFNALGANADADAVPRAVSGAGAEGGRRPGEPATRYPTSKFYEVQKYLTITSHIYNPQALIVSKKFWDTLTRRREEDHPRRRGRSARASSARSRAAQADTALDDAEEGGHAGHRPAARRNARKLRDKVKPVIDKHTRDRRRGDGQGDLRRDRQGAQVRRGASGASKEPANDQRQDHPHRAHRLSHRKLQGPDDLQPVVRQDRHRCGGGADGLQARGLSGLPSLAVQAHQHPGRAGDHAAQDRDDGAGRRGDADRAHRRRLQCGAEAARRHAGRRPVRRRRLRARRATQGLVAAGQRGARGRQWRRGLRHRCVAGRCGRRQDRALRRQRCRGRSAGRCACGRTIRHWRSAPARAIRQASTWWSTPRRSA